MEFGFYTALSCMLLVNTIKAKFHYAILLASQLASWFASRIA